MSVCYEVSHLAGEYYTVEFRREDYPSLRVHLSAAECLGLAHALGTCVQDRRTGLSAEEVPDDDPPSRLDLVDEESPGRNGEMGSAPNL